MADTTTTNLGLTKPEVGASADTWGNKLNTDLDLVDGVFAAAGSGTSVGLNVGAGKTITVDGTLNVTGTLSGGVVAPLASPTFTGTVTLPATTSIGTVSATEIGYIDGVTSSVQTQLDGKLSTSVAASTYAPLASPALTGAPTAPTAAGGTNTTQIATTAFVADNFAPTVSPAFTGSPTAPTAATGTSTTQLATTQFVNATAFSSALPNQTGNAGKFVTTDGTDASWVAIPPEIPAQAGQDGKYLTTDGTDASWADLPPSGPTLTAVASGSLSDGSTVIINVDGTVSIAEIAGGAGSPTVFESASTSFISAAYDTVNQKVVIAYRDGDNSGYGTAVVGTVSGTSISFGTPVVFESASTYFISATYNTTAQRVVIAYRDDGNSRFGTAIVGAVSGTTISFGTAVVFQSSDTGDISATYHTAQNVIFIACRDANNVNIGRSIAATVSGTTISFGSPVTFNNARTVSISTAYHAAQQRVVVAYQDGGNADQGTAIVGTLTGTVISYGAEVVFETGFTSYTAATYDANTQRIVIAYMDGGNSSYGTAVVGTVSGTSISFGTPVVFESASTAYISIAYDTVTLKVTIAYKDVGNSDFGTAIVGTVSGTTISFGTAYVFESASIDFTSTVYDANAQKFVIAYADNGNSVYGTALTFSVPVTNLTSENFIGFSSAAYTDGQTATIQIAGSVDDAQSGLTPGQSYYVQPSGALGLSPGVPSVFAGTAVAATKIIVKG